MKKWMIAVLCAGLTIGILSGCSGQAASDADTAVSAEPSQTVQETTAPDREAGPEQAQPPEQIGVVRAMVTSVDGNTVTARTMAGSMGGPMGGGRPDREGAAQEGQADDSVQPSDLPENNQSDGQSKPDGQMPAYDSEMPQGQPGDEQTAPDGEEIVIAITSDINLSVEADGQTNEGTVADITEGCMIGITYADDGETVDSIVVYQQTGDMPSVNETK